MPKPRVLLPRALALTALAFLGAWLLSRSSFLALAPAPPPWPILALVLAVAFMPALFARASPLPATLVILVPVLGASAYDQSRLDWLRLLKDFGVTDPGAPDLARVSLGLVALALAYGMHAFDHATRLRLRAAQRGFEPRESRAAFRASLGAAGRRGALALGATLVLGVVGLVAGAFTLDAVLAGRSALLAPLLAGALVVAAALLLSRKS